MFQPRFMFVVNIFFFKELSFFLCSLKIMCCKYCAVCLFAPTHYFGYELFLAWLLRGPLFVFYCSS
uniref:Uncharacterized protein n=1 Tax=Anguilla anguilla TaxID=7936 RepID=A0A0E9XEC6_ANGAN